MQVYTAAGIAAGYVSAVRGRQEAATGAFVLLTTSGGASPRCAVAVTRRNLCIPVHPGDVEVVGNDHVFARRRFSTVGLLPLVRQAGTVTATLDLGRIATGRRTFDATGHYARPDILELTITPERRTA